MITLEEVDEETAKQSQHVIDPYYGEIYWDVEGISGWCGPGWFTALDGEKVVAPVEFYRLPELEMQ